MFKVLLGVDSGGWSFSEAMEPAHDEAKLLYHEMSQLLKPSSKASVSKEMTSSADITSFNTSANVSTAFLWPTIQTKCTEQIEKSVDLSHEGKNTRETNFNDRNDDGVSVVSSIVDAMEPAREEAECIYNGTRSFVSSNLGALGTIEEKHYGEEGSARSSIADAIEPAKEEAILLVNEAKTYLANAFGSMQTIQERDNDDDNSSVLRSIGGAIDPAREQVQHLYSKPRSLISTNVGTVRTFEKENDNVSVLDSLADSIEPTRQKSESICDKTKSFFVSSKGKLEKLEAEDGIISVISSLVEPIGDQHSLDYAGATSFIKNNIAAASNEDDDTSAVFTSISEAIEPARVESIPLYQEITSLTAKLLLQASIAEIQNSKGIVTSSCESKLEKDPCVDGKGSASYQEAHEASVPAYEILDDNLTITDDVGTQEIARLLKELLMKDNSAQSDPSIEEASTLTGIRRGSFQRRLDNVFDQASLDLFTIYHDKEKSEKVCTL